MDLFYGFLLIIIAQIGTFFQLQGQFLWPWMSKNPWAPALLGFPISYLFIQSVKHTVTWFDGQLWPSRLIGFATGVVVYAIMAYILFREPVTLKTMISILLGMVILAIQLFWK
jgi:hypothetical protein